MDYSYFTDFGDRKINEDRVGAAFHDEACCFVVADGLGGHGGGETAAQTAVDTVCVQFVENGFHDHFFERAFSAAQEAILQKQERIGAHSQMKTTLVVLVIDRDKAYWAHVGDSRLYFFRGGKLRTRTLDHSVPQMLALSGDISEAYIRHHPDRSRLLRVMGVRGESPRYEAAGPVLLSGNMDFLMCTDGFWELICEDKMAAALKQTRTCEEWLEHMHAIVEENGAECDRDNCTALAVRTHTARGIGRLLR